MSRYAGEEGGVGWEEEGRREGGSRRLTTAAAAPRLVLSLAWGGKAGALALALAG